MLARARSFTLTVLGLLIISFPFLWLKLNYDYSRGTVAVEWALENGLSFFQNLIPVFIIALVFGALAGLEKRFHWQKLLRDSLSPLARMTAEAWWKPLLLILILDGIFVFNDKYLGLAIMMGIYMIQAVGL